MTIFSYVNLSGRPVTVSTDHLPWRGAWSSAGTYQIGDWVLYAGDNYIALAVSTNAIPNASPSFWALLVPRQVIPEPLITDQVYTSTVTVNPNGTVIPVDPTVGNIFYHEANGTVDRAWSWSVSTGSWYQAPLGVQFIFGSAGTPPTPSPYPTQNTLYFGTGTFTTFYSWNVNGQSWVGIITA